MPMLGTHQAAPKRARRPRVAGPGPGLARRDPRTSGALWNSPATHHLVRHPDSWFRHSCECLLTCWHTGLHGGGSRLTKCGDTPRTLGLESNLMIYQGNAVSVQLLDDGIAELKFDLQGESVNKFNRATLEDFQKAIDAIKGSDQI